MEPMRKWNWSEEGLRMGSSAFLRFYKVRIGWWGRVGMGDGARTDSLQD